MEWLHIFIQTIILFSGFGLWITGIILCFKYKSRLVGGVFVLYSCLSLRMAVNIIMGLLYQVDMFYEWLITRQAVNSVLLFILGLVNKLAIVLILVLLPFIISWYAKQRYNRFLFLLVYGWLAINILLRIIAAVYINSLLPIIETVEIIVFLLLIILAGIIFYRQTRAASFLEKGTRLMVLAALLVYLPLSLVLYGLDAFNLLIISPLIFIYLRSVAFFLLTTAVFVLVIRHLTDVTPARPLTEQLPELAVRYQFSRRETDVFQLLVSFHSYKEIAGQLFISVDTVKSHIKSIYRKTRTGSRAELLRAVNRG